MSVTTKEVAETSLATILTFIDKGLDELHVRRIWDAVRIELLKKDPSILTPTDPCVGHEQ